MPSFSQIRSQKLAVSTFGNIKVNDRQAAATIIQQQHQQRWWQQQQYGSVDNNNSGRTVAAGWRGFLHQFATKLITTSRRQASHRAPKQSGTKAEGSKWQGKNAQGICSAVLLHVHQVEDVKQGFRHASFIAKLGGGGNKYFATYAWKVSWQRLLLWAPYLRLPIPIPRAPLVSAILPATRRVVSSWGSGSSSNTNVVTLGQHINSIHNSEIYSRPSFLHFVSSFTESLANRWVHRAVGGEFAFYLPHYLSL